MCFLTWSSRSPQQSLTYRGGFSRTTCLIEPILVIKGWLSIFCSVQFSCSSCPTLCNPMDCSTPDLPVHHQLPEPTQTHVHWVSDAIQPSHPLPSPSPPAFNLSQHQGFCQRVGSSHQVAKHWNFSSSPSNEYSGLIFFRIDWFDLLAVQGLSRVFSNTRV